MTTFLKKANSRHKFLDGVSLLEAVLYGWAAFILVLGMLAYLQDSGFAWPLKATTLVGTAALVALARYAGLPKIIDVLSWNTLGIAFLCATTVATFWWAWRFDSVQNSDFGVYFRCGAEAGLPIAKWIDTCQSAYLHQNLIYWSRSLLYTVPLESAAGSNYFALKLYNAALHSVTSALWFLGLRHYYGAKIATIASVLLAFYPEWWFTTTLATTDNAALFFIAAFILLLPKLDTATHKSLVMLGLALILFAANLLRAVGPILVTGLLLWAAIRQSTRWDPPTMARTLVVLLLYGLMNWLLKGFTPPNASDPLLLLKMVSTVDFNTTQNFTVNYPWGEHFWFAIADEWRAQVAINKLSLEFLNGFNRWPVYLYQKASILFAGSGYYALSSFPYTGFNPDTVFNVPASTVPFLPQVIPWLTSMIFFSLVLAAWTLLSGRIGGPALVSAVWIGAVSLIVLGISEAQARYSVLIAPPLSLLAALAFFREPRSTEQIPVRKIWGLSAATGFIVTAVAFGALIAGLHFIKSTQPNPLSLATLSPAGETVAVQCSAQPVAAKIETSFKRLRIINPPGSDCVTIALPLSESVKALTFFASGSKFPYLWEPPIRSPYRYTLELSNRVILDTSLDENAVLWHRIDLGRGDTENTQRVLLTVTRTDTSTEDFIDFSLYTEIP